MCVSYNSTQCRTFRKQIGSTNHPLNCTDLVVWYYTLGLVGVALWVVSDT